MKKIFNNQMYSRIILSILVLINILCFSCKKEERLDYIDYNTPAPSQITDIAIKATAGGSIINYKLPNDPNFYYAKAVYEIQPNVYREAKASFYNDTLILEGYGDTLEHEVKIYSVGRNEKQSDPILIKVKPLKPPVLSIFGTLQLVATFGGVQVSFSNPSMANIAIVVMKDTTNLKTWSTLQTFYTGAESGRFSIRGLDSSTQKFAVFIRDRWNNKSDTLLKNLSPLFEQAIPKNTWNPLVLPTDQTEIAQSIYALKNLWDGKFPALASGSYASSNSSKLPQWFTIDLGVKVVMNRVVEHQVNHSAHFYSGSAPLVIEIWGSNSPNRDGSWASWDSLGTFHSFKPSGLPLGQTTGEDVTYGQIQGENFEFDHVLPSYRYIRWKTNSTYSSSGQVVISEIDIYGQLK